MNTIIIILLSWSGSARAVDLSNFIRFERGRQLETHRGPVDAHEIRIGDVLRLSDGDFEVQGASERLDIMTLNELFAGDYWAGPYVAAGGLLSTIAVIINPAHPFVAIGCAMALTSAPAAAALDMNQVLPRLYRRYAVHLRLDRPRAVEAEGPTAPGVEP